VAGLGSLRWRAPFPVGRTRGVRLTYEEPGFWVFTLPDGSNVEVFDMEYGFAGQDLAAAAELRAAGVELLGDAGPTWQHFRGPTETCVSRQFFAGLPRILGEGVLEVAGQRQGCEGQ
jgi:hypothetical protein